MMKDKQQNSIEAQIDRYVNGQLSQEEIESLWAKILQRPEYMSYLKTTTNLKEVVRRKEEQPVMHKMWVYAAAAVFVLVIGVLAVMHFADFNASTKAVKPIDKIELDYNRSAGKADLSDKQKVIRKAMELYNSGKFKEAVHLLSMERQKAKQADWLAELDITLGTMQYDEDNFDQAAFYFGDVVKHKDKVGILKLERAYWYLGNSYFQMNKLAEAKENIQKAYDLNGAYRRVAKSYLDAMSAKS